MLSGGNGDQLQIGPILQSQGICDLALQVFTGTKNIISNKLAATYSPIKKIECKLSSHYFAIKTLL